MIIDGHKYILFSTSDWVGRYHWITRIKISGALFFYDNLNGGDIVKRKDRKMTTNDTRTWIYLRVYCSCNLPADNRAYIQCSKCENWVCIYILALCLSVDHI